VQDVFATTLAELLEFQPLRGLLLILIRHVIALFALGALQNYVVSHYQFSVFSFQFSVVQN